MRLILNVEHIRAVAPSNPDPAAVVAALTPVLARHEIDASPERLGMFLGQWAHESNFVCQSENLNYSAQRLCAVWPNRFPTLASARPFAMNPQSLANRVYNGRMGNAPGSDDGWTYRGRGWPQLTGRDAYRTYGRLVGVDLEAQPDLMLRPAISAAVCGAYWHARNLGRLADEGDMISVTRGINGGHNGLEDRILRYRRVVPLLREQAQALAAQETVVHPVTRLFVNGVEVPLAEARIAEDLLTLPHGTFRVGKRSQVGHKLYVTTVA